MEPQAPLVSGLELYCVQTITSSSEGAVSKHSKTAITVSVQLEGERGNTNWRTLYPFDGPSKKAFLAGKTDEFYLVENDIGQIQRISLKAEGKIPWHIESVRVKTAGKQYRCEIKEVLHYNTITKDLMQTIDSGPLVLGPILKMKGFEWPFWRLSALIVTENIDEIPPLSFCTSIDPTLRKSKIPICIFTHYRWKAWRFDFEVKLTGIPQIVTYSLTDESPISFYVPALHERPRITFASCLDLAHPNCIPSPEMKVIMFDYLLRDHNVNQYHLYVLGGDQVYADPVFAASRAIQDWQFGPNQIGKWREPFTDEMRYEIECFYFKLYCICWDQGAFPTVLMMMWDDHDIFDGWGSLNPHEHHSPVYQGLFQMAKKMYFIFQQQGELSSTITPYNSEGPYSFGSILTGDTAILLPDLRTERNMISHRDSNVFSEGSWIALESWVNEMSQQDLSHLFVVSSVPIVYPHTNFGEFILDKLNHNLVDDSRDH